MLMKTCITVYYEIQFQCDNLGGFYYYYLYRVDFSISKEKHPVQITKLHENVYEKVSA